MLIPVDVGVAYAAHFAPEGCPDGKGEWNRDGRGSLGPEDAAGDVGVHDVARRAGGPPDARVPGGLDEARLSAAMHRGSPRDASRTRRLDGPRRRRRAEAGEGRHRRGVGALTRQPGWWLVRHQEGTSRSIRDVRSTLARSVRPRGTR